MVVWQFNLYKGALGVLARSGGGVEGMTDSLHARTNIAALLAILALSAATMVWSFWRFPVITTLATVAILLGLGVCARLARLTDSDMTDLKQTEPSV